MAINRPTGREKTNPIKANFKTIATPKGVEQRSEAGLRLMTDDDGRLVPLAWSIAPR